MEPLKYAVSAEGRKLTPLKASPAVPGQRWGEREKCWAGESEHLKERTVSSVRL